MPQLVPIHEDCVVAPPIQLHSPHPSLQDPAVLLEWPLWPGKGVVSWTSNQVHCLQAKYQNCTKLAALQASMPNQGCVLCAANNTNCVGSGEIALQREGRLRSMHNSIRAEL
jgi:hypothetical protein